MLALAARCAAGELRREAGGEQQLEPERERVGAAGPRRLAVEQRQLVGEQVIDAGMRLAVVEHARDGFAGARRAVERRAVLAQPRVGSERLRARHGQQVAAALVEHQPQAEERLQPPPEPRPLPAHALGDRAYAPPIRGIQVQYPVGLAIAQAAQHDALGLQRPGHVTTLNVGMSRLTIYTTEPCGFCRVAKNLLQKRNVPFSEINLAKDPSGRAELVRMTGMMTFPQVVIDERPIGGYQELIQIDRAGTLAELATAA